MRASNGRGRKGVCVLGVSKGVCAAIALCVFSGGPCRRHLSLSPHFVCFVFLSLVRCRAFSMGKQEFFVLLLLFFVLFCF